MSQQIILNGESGLNVRNALNQMFAELYASLNPPILITDASTTFSQAIIANTMVLSIFLTTLSGTPTIRIGTSLNGEEILPDTEIDTYQLVSAQQYFLASGALYFTWTGGIGEVNVRIDAINNYN